MLVLDKLVLDFLVYLRISLHSLIFGHASVSVVSCWSEVVVEEKQLGDVVVDRGCESEERAERYSRDKQAFSLRVAYGWLHAHWHCYHKHCRAGYIISLRKMWYSGRLISCNTTLS